MKSLLGSGEATKLTEPGSEPLSGCLYRHLLDRCVKSISITTSSCQDRVGYRFENMSYAGI